MKSNQPSRLAAVQASLFENPSSNYALLAMLALVAGATFVFGGNLAPGLATHVVMLFTMLAASRMFSPYLLRLYWYLCVGLIVFMLLLDVALLLMAA